MNKQHFRTALSFLAAAALSVSLFGCSSKHEEVVIPVVEDSVLTANVKAALAADPELKGAELTAAANSGVVTLSGAVDNYPQIDRALAVVRAVVGVKSVDDKTTKKESAAPAAAPVAAPAAAPAAPAAQ